MLFSKIFFSQLTYSYIVGFFFLQTVTVLKCVPFLRRPVLVSHVVPSSLFHPPSSSSLLFFMGSLASRASEGERPPSLHPPTTHCPKKLDRRSPHCGPSFFFLPPSPPILAPNRWKREEDVVRVRECTEPTLHRIHEDEKEKKDSTT